MKFASILSLLLGALAGAIGAGEVGCHGGASAPTLQTDHLVPSAPVIVNSRRND
jgi:hypothetical protein